MCIEYIILHFDGKGGNKGGHLRTRKKPNTRGGASCVRPTVIVDDRLHTAPILVILLLLFFVITSCLPPPPPPRSRLRKLAELLGSA